VEAHLPIGRHAALRSRHGLLYRMVCGRSKRLRLEELVSAVVVEPVFARLEARNDGVLGLVGVRRRMLRRRVVTASDVATLRTATQVEPPTPYGLAFGTPGTTRRFRRVDRLIGQFTAFQSPRRFYPKGARRLLRLSSVADDRGATRARGSGGSAGLVDQ
jgi:hypothetical protein